MKTLIAAALVAGLAFDVTFDLAHAGPLPEERFQGNLAPSIVGAASRSTAAQLRLRLIDGRRLNPDSIMPSYYRVAGLTRVGNAWQSRPILDAQQIEDVVAYLKEGVDFALKSPMPDGEEGGMWVFSEGSRA